jgi:fibronectin type 3 domain-containing protein
VEIAVWIVAGIFALNVLLVGAIAGFLALRRHRVNKEIMQLETLWRVPGGYRPSHVSRQPAGRMLIGAGLAAVIAWAGMTIAGPGARRVVTSALGVVVPGFRLAPSERQGQGAPGGADEGSSLGQGADASEGGTSSSTPGFSSTETTLFDDPTVPATIAALPRSPTSIHLSWDEVPTATAYHIERSDDGDTGWDAIARTEVDVTTYVDTGLSSETTYFYRVLAMTEAGEAPPSDVVSATTLVLPPSRTTLKAVSISPTEIDLLWSDVSDETGYRIERSPDGVSGWVPIATTGQDVATWWDTGLAPATTYYYRIFAVNEGGESPPSDVVFAATSTAIEPTIDPGGIDPGAVEPGGGSLGIGDPAVTDPSPSP